MKNLRKNICTILVLTVLFSFLTEYIPVSAASVERYTLSEITAEQFTNSEILKEGLQNVIDSYPVAFTKDGKVCSRSHVNGESNCLWFTPHQSYDKHNSRATQCYGYANYVYETIFGTYWPCREYSTSAGTIESTKTGTKAKAEFERIGVAFGTIMRSSSAYHSFVILSYDENGVWLIHANYAGSNYGGCNTSVYHYTWAAFASAYSQINIIIIPDSVCENCTYSQESFPVCTVCSHRIPIQDEMYANYKAIQETKFFTIPFDGFETEEIIPAESQVIITRLITVADRTWAKTADGRYIPSEMLEFASYIPTMQLNDAKYPDTYIVSGKSFWLAGRITSKNTITSLTVEILDSEGNVVDTNTISPDRLYAEVADADNLLFSELKTGYYTFRLAAKDLSEEKVLIESPFRVISSTTLKKAFPDENFRKYVKETILGDAEMKDGSYVDLYDDMWGKVTEINVSGMEISSLRGIEYFPALTSLDASENHITTLDLSGFEKLQTVNVSGQTVDITAAYDREKALFTVSTDIFSKDYPRGTIFPLTEEIQTDINFNEMKMDVTFNVSADIDSLSDVNGDGKVNSDDLSYVLCYYGMESSSHEDVNYDGKVNQEDISLLLGNYS